MKNKKIKKIIITIIVIALFVSLIIYISPILKNLLTQEGRLLEQAQFGDDECKFCELEN